jgi:hypothetical protein
MSEAIPHDCPVCGLMFRDMNDVLSFEEYECCTDCQDHFAYRDLAAWRQGHRPSQQEVEKFREQLLSNTSYLANKL